MVYWAFKPFRRGERSPPQCPARPDQLYKWAWDIEKEKELKKEEKRRQWRPEDEADAADLPDSDEIEWEPLR